MAETNSVSNISLILWCVQNLVSTFAALGYARGLPRSEVPGVEPSVAIVLPVKGDENLVRLLPLLRGQNYARYRIIASVESPKDPAFPVLRAAQLQPGAPIEVAVAGLATNAGQKVWNQLAALERLNPGDEIVAFIDADTLPTPMWLPRMVAVIVNSGRPVVTGYRWMAPADDRLSSSCLAAANASIATLPRGAGMSHLCWGGSVAMRRSTLEEIKLRDYWVGAISDDLQMTKALQRSGISVHAARQGLLLTPISSSWLGLFTFGVRQYRLIWMHEPKSWAVALLCLWGPPIFLILAIPSLASGSPGAWTALAFIAALGEARTRLRQEIQTALWPEIGRTRVESCRWRVDRLLRPVWWLSHALCAASAPLSRTIDWAGIRYRVDGPQAVIVERRDEPG